MQFVYFHILQSGLATDHFYAGRTENFHSQLKKQNVGEVSHTAKCRPWRIKTAVAFGEEKRAIEFEHYLKTASGSAFAKKRL